MVSKYLHSHRMTHPMHGALQATIKGSQGPPTEATEFTKNPCVKTHNTAQGPQNPVCQFIER